MMTSDSEESDYEDARQHHDNLVDSDSVTPAPSSSRQNVNVSNVNEIEIENNVNDNIQMQGPLGEAQAVTPPPQPALDQVVPPPPEEPEQLQRVFIRDDIFENDEVFRELQNFVRLQQNARHMNRPGNGNNRNNPNHRFPMVVDSDSDDEAQLQLLAEQGDNDSDDEIEIDAVWAPPQLIDEGERNRADGASDGNDVQDDADLDDVPEFDQELPIRHSYLGEGMEELQGRVVLEEDATPEIPLIALGNHLIPGQTLPLQVYHAVFQNAIRRCVLGDRLFGIVHNDMNTPGGNVIYIGALGTLAEIFEFQEESDGEGNGGMSSTFAVKAKGRQRFNVLEVRRQADGNLMGKVRIRPEIRLESFVLNVLSPTTSRTFLPPAREEYEESGESHNQNQMEVESSSSASGTAIVGSSRTPTRFTFSRRDSLSSVMSTATSIAVTEHDLKTLQMKIGSQRKRLKYYAALTPHPYFVYEHYDETVLVEKVHRLLTNELKGVAKSKGKIPMDASDLSFWLAQNLLIDDTHRSKVLKMDCPIQRLRYYLELLGRTTKVISCRNCESNIADHSQIFSMSIEGPQGTYVNPHGFVHETLTVYKTKDLVTRGGPSTEASWFPGYSWTIVECKRCRAHIGWKFQAVGRLKPPRFWGLARRSVISKYNFGSDSEIQESLDIDTFRTPPNSANSEAFSTVQLF